MKFIRKTLLYENSLSNSSQVKNFVMEGLGAVTFTKGRMRMESLLDPEEGQKANIVFWCDKDFPDNIEISWDFYPIKEPGLCMLFFAAKGRNNEDIFSPNLSKRDGQYSQYNRGDINTLHVSYFRRKAISERAFNVCNLRKSYGFHLVAQGADPIPCVNDARPPYRIQVIKYGPEVLFSINDLELFHWIDDGISYGEVLRDGKIGFRQMAPLIAEYANLTVYEVEKLKE